MQPRPVPTPYPEAFVLALLGTLLPAPTLSPQEPSPGLASSTSLEAILGPPLLEMPGLPPEPAAPLDALRLSPHLGTPEALQALTALAGAGSGAAPALARLLRVGPPHARMAAAVLLGAQCASPASVPLLCLALDDAEPGPAMAAALALRDLKDPAAAARLLLPVSAPRPETDPAVRAAAASALTGLGSPAGVPFLLALLEAGIPGIEPGFGLPRKDRWALEKEIALDALRRLAGKTLGYEPEQGWEEMKAGAARWRRWWEEEGRPSQEPLPRALQQVLAAAAERVEKALPALPAGEKARAKAWLAAARPGPQGHCGTRPEATSAKSRAATSRPVSPGSPRPPRLPTQTTKT